VPDGNAVTVIEVRPVQPGRTPSTALNDEEKGGVNSCGTTIPAVFQHGSGKPTCSNPLSNHVFSPEEISVDSPSSGQ